MLKRVAIGLVCLVAACVLLLNSCAIAPYTQGDVGALVPDARTAEIAIDSRMLFTVSAGDPQNPPVVFIHGTPGGWDAYASYLNAPVLREQFHLISLDRPGFGRSDRGTLEVSMAQQARLIARAIPPGQPAILVGHSLGGPIAVQLAADFPELVRGLVLVAGSFDPVLEEPRWYNAFADSRLVRWAVPDDLRYANDEVMGLAEELRRLEPRWTELAQRGMPMALIQGEKDRLVYPANIDFAEARVPEAHRTTTRVKDAGHFILWEQPDLIIDAIADIWARGE